MTSLSRRENTTRLILQAASELFLLHGFRNISVDCIASHAGTTKVTVYQHFKSKEDILLNCLTLRIDTREAALDERFSDPIPSPAILLDFFDWMETTARKGSFTGCAFTKALNEVAETLPEVRRIAQRSKRLLRERLVSLAIASGISEPEPLGDSLAILLEGAQTLSLIERKLRPFCSARTSAIKLLACHGWPSAPEHPAAPGVRL